MGRAARPVNRIKPHSKTVPVSALQRQREGNSPEVSEAIRTATQSAIAASKDYTDKIMADHVWENITRGWVFAIAVFVMMTVFNVLASLAI